MEDRSWSGYDGDGHLGYSEITASDKNPFAIVNQANYDSSVSNLGNVATTGDLALFTYAPAIVNAFLNDAPIALPGNVTTSSHISSNGFGLDHNTGAIFNSSNSAPIRQNNFAPQTDFAKYIAKSDQFKSMAFSTLSANLQTIRNYFTSSSSTSRDFIFNGPASSDFVDSDLHYALGKSTYTGLRYLFSVTYDPAASLPYSVQANALVSGTVDDLADFAYKPTFNGLGDLLARVGAMVQAGYGTLGTSGAIFNTEIVLGSNSTNTAAVSFV